jgi:hypothetical protein
VGETFELTYELTKGSKAAHGHVYLDGEPQKKFPGTFKGLSKGKHEIKVQAATHDHDHLAAIDTITVERAVAADRVARDRPLHQPLHEALVIGRISR